jgi:putative oxidoreductase
VGGLSILLGYRAKLGAWLLVLFLVPVTLAMHQFWAAHDPMMAQIQQVNFMKNLSLLGAALFISQAGAGPLSLDTRRG